MGAIESDWNKHADLGISLVRAQRIHRLKVSSPVRLGRKKICSLEELCNHLEVLESFQKRRETGTDPQHQAQEYPNF